MISLGDEGVWAGPASRAPGFLSLGLTFGFIQRSAVGAGLGHTPHSLEAAHELHQEGNHLKKKKFQCICAIN